MLRVVFGAILAGVAGMAWGTYFWMFSPFADETMKPMPEQLISPLVSLKESDVGSGYYFYPYPDADMMSGTDPKKLEEFNAAHREGPLVQLVFVRAGVEPMSPTAMAIGFGHLVLSSFFLGLVLYLALPATSSFCSRWTITSLVAVFATIALQLREIVWFHHPWKPVVAQAGFDIVNWVLAGFVLALVIRPTRSD